MIRINHTPDVTVYKKHHCDAKHRAFKTFAKCVWPRAEWITGDGEWASVSYCRVTTVKLFETYEEAAQAKRLIDSDACGGDCWNNHKVVRLEK